MKGVDTMAIRTHTSSGSYPAIYGPDGLSTIDSIEANEMGARGYLVTSTTRSVLVHDSGCGRGAGSRVPQPHRRGFEHRPRGEDLSERAGSPTATASDSWK